MYNRGDFILFSMKGRIADEINDPQNGRCYIVECDDPNRTVIRIPEGNIDMRFAPEHPMPQVRNPFATRARAQVVMQNSLSLPESPRRPNSPNPIFINGVEQKPNMMSIHRPRPIFPPHRSFGPNDNWGEE